MGLLLVSVGNTVYTLFILQSIHRYSTYINYPYFYNIPACQRTILLSIGISTYTSYPNLYTIPVCQQTIFELAFHFYCYRVHQPAITSLLSFI